MGDVGTPRIVPIDDNTKLHDAMRIVNSRYTDRCYPYLCCSSLPTASHQANGFLGAAADSLVSPCR